MGSQVGTFIFPPLYKHLLDENDWKITTVIMGGLVMNCAVGGALFRPLTKAKAKRMKRGVIQRGAIMKALIAEKERQRTISNGSLDNCIITKDNRLIKIDKIDLRNKSSSYINRLKETFGFSSRSLNRSKNSLIVPKVVVTDPIYKPKSPKPVPKNSPNKTASPQSSPKKDTDSGCGSLDSPNLRVKSYEQVPTDDPWSKDDNIPLTDMNKASVSHSNINSENSPKKCVDEKLDPSLLSNNSTPAGSANSLNTKFAAGSVQSGKNILLPFTGSVMSSVVHSGELVYQEGAKNYKLMRKMCKYLDLKLLTLPSFIILVVANFCVMLGK